VIERVFMVTEKYSLSSYLTYFVKSLVQHFACKDHSIPLQYKNLKPPI
jgi:hypothetical protein